MGVIGFVIGVRGEKRIPLFMVEKVFANHGLPFCNGKSSINVEVCIY